jgi:hypothetical protein
MSWKLTGNPKTKAITLALAQQFAEMEAAVHDRPMSEKRLQVYEKLMRAGQFRPVSWAMTYCQETGGTYRVNGKHTSTVALGLIQREELPEVYAVVEVYQCDTLDDVARLYATYDNKLQSRTVSDINASFASVVPQLQGITPTIINVCVSGMSYALHQEQYVNVVPAERAEVLIEQHDFVLWFQAMRGRVRKENVHFQRIPVVAAMKLMYDRSKKQATVFWELVRDETDPVPDAPARRLSRFLLTHGRIRGRQQGPLRYRVSNREFFVKCIHAWNAWRTDTPSNLAYHVNAELPDVHP